MAAVDPSAVTPAPSGRIPHAVIEVWRAEAAKKIKVQNIGVGSVVLVEGHKVAEFLSWGGLVTDRRRFEGILDHEAEATAYADKLRLAYVDLARGDA